MPVVVFDAPDPELIGLRILSSLWPDIRAGFALSTFALSPRRIGGRDFDLVFAPLNAKAKFAGWAGRKIDGRLQQAERHRWTGAVVRRVFVDPNPKLLSARENELVRGNSVNSASVLRIALLWDELVAKVEQTPTAVLGLLDIANSGLVNSDLVSSLLEHRLVSAARNVAVSLPVDDAWDFVGAIVRKLQSGTMPAGHAAIERLATNLAKRSPRGAIELLRRPDVKGEIGALVPSIAAGFSEGAKPQIENALIDAPPDVFAKLVFQNTELSKLSISSDALIEKTGAVLRDAAAPQFADDASAVLLPLLVEARHLPVAEPIFEKLDSIGVANELRWLGHVNDFGAMELCEALLARAEEIDGFLAARDALISLKPSPRRDEMIEATLRSSVADVLWVINRDGVSEDLKGKLLAILFRHASVKELRELLSHEVIGVGAVRYSANFEIDILARIVLEDALPLNAYAHFVRAYISKADGEAKAEVVSHALKKFLSISFEEDDGDTLLLLLNALGSKVDGLWVVKVGLSRGLSAEVASRNAIIFERSQIEVRACFVAVVDEFARMLKERRNFDLSEDALDACAKLMFDAGESARNSYGRAAAWLVAPLLLARRRPVSLLVAALFPEIYLRLDKDEEASDFFGVFSFLGKYSRKSAREDLVEAFVYSSWRPGHFALTAIRCGDAPRFFARVLKLYRGEEYLIQVEKDLSALSVEDQYSVNRAIAKVRPASRAKRNR
ncbi:hypothetical protein SAMN05421681_104347 [Lysobacter enzymogenes]|nr:hypothetical protein SAMN05421681_104347 [Lysobacter enzymogenes]